MTLELRILTVSLAAFALAGLAAALVVPALASRLGTNPAVLRARRLAMLRLLPAGAATAAGLVVTAAFLAFEPRQSGEYMGWVLKASALFGATLLLATAWRWIRVAHATRRLARAWLVSAEPVALAGIGLPAMAVTSSFPVVAVVGLLRPRLVIARSVLAACTHEELQAILAHEQGHLDRRDNLSRLMLAVTPDVLAWLPASARIFEAWCHAAEEAADDDAVRIGKDGRLCLASALVKVARLASGPPASSLMPASALYSGENLDGRVRRLLEPRTGAATPRPHGAEMLAAVASLAIVSAFALQELYALIEVAIRVLP